MAMFQVLPDKIYTEETKHCIKESHRFINRKFYALRKVTKNGLLTDARIDQIYNDVCQILFNFRDVLKEDIKKK